MTDFHALTKDYQEQGFVVCEALLSADEISQLLNETVAIARGKRGAVRGITPADDDMSDDAVLSQYLTVQFPHKVSELIRDHYIAHPKITEILSHLIGPDVKSMQSMLFIKKSGKPGQAWHQDEHFIPTRDRSLLGAWIALDDATVENGCLWVRPGSHKDGIIYPTRPHNQSEFDEGNELCDTPDDTDKGRPVEVKKGSVVFFNGYLHHRSLANRAPKGTFRRALVNHYMNARSYLPWDWDGRIPPTNDMRDIIMVCGTDPYAHKGIENITYAFLRAETNDKDDPNRDPHKKVF